MNLSRPRHTVKLRPFKIDHLIDPKTHETFRFYSINRE